MLPVSVETEVDRLKDLIEYAKANKIKIIAVAIERFKEVFQEVRSKLLSTPSFPMLTYS